MTVTLEIDLTAALQILSPAEFRRRFGQATEARVRTVETAEGLEIRVPTSEASARAARRLQTEQFIFLNSPESNVCPICLSLQRTVWDAGDPRMPLPPLHPNCACMLAPYVTEDSPLRTEDDSGATTKPQDRGEVLGRYLRTASTTAIARMFGKRVARLVRLGVVKPLDLITQFLDVRTVNDLLNRVLGVSRQQFDELSDTAIRRLARARRGGQLVG